jgi:hypothetical protein
MNQFVLGYAAGIGSCLLFWLLVMAHFDGLKAEPKPPEVEVRAGEHWSLIRGDVPVVVRVLSVTDKEVHYFMSEAFSSNSMSKTMFTAIYEKVAS